MQVGHEGARLEHQRAVARMGDDLVVFEQAQAHATLRQGQGGQLCLGQVKGHVLPELELRLRRDMLLGEQLQIIGARLATDDRHVCVEVALRLLRVDEPLRLG
jgi:hypothetical protein